MRKFTSFEVAVGIIVTFFSVFLFANLGYAIEHCGSNSSIDIYYYFENLVIDSPLVFLNEIFIKSSKVQNFAILGFIVPILVFLIIYTQNYSKKYRIGKEHGSSRFATMNEIKTVADKNEKNNTIISQNVKMSLNGRKIRRNMNTLIVGGSGDGKTRFFLKPNILQDNSSFVITDPKGEILQSLGNFLKEKNYKIKVFNLVEMGKSDFYNPFEYIREGYEEDVITLINTIIVNTSAGKKGGDPFWDNSEKLLLQAIFFYIMEVGSKEEKNMSMVLKLLSLIEVRDDEPNFKSPLDIMFEDFEEEYGDHIALRQYKAFRTAPAKTALSIAITASSRLAPFNIDTVANVMNSDNLELDKIGEEKTALFIITSPADTTFNFIASMMYTQLFIILDFRANRVHGGSLPIPVRFFLDEFANIGKIPNFEKILAYARSLNIGIVPILQSMSQLKEMYEKSYASIIDNCNTILFLGGTGTETTEYVSKMLGKETINHTALNKSYQRGKSISFNNNILGRELMTSSEIRIMGVEECLIFIKALNPFKDLKYKYEEHKNYKYTADYDINNTYELKENEERIKNKFLEYIEDNGLYKVLNEELLQAEIIASTVEDGDYNDDDVEKYSNLLDEYEKN